MSWKLNTFLVILLLSSIVVSFLYSADQPDVCCEALKICPEGQINIQVPSSYKDSFCCQICGTEQQKIEIRDTLEKQRNARAIFGDYIPIIVMFLSILSLVIILIKSLVKKSEK